MIRPTSILGCLTLAAATFISTAETPRSWSGIFPHLAYFNNEGECGTGAVVPWADRLWVITYGPHLPHGSSDKLYEISSDLKLTKRPESVGGTPANRMIHPESQQLFIGPYAIDAAAKVRVISPAAMQGRLTGNARHLTDPKGKIYFGTMEEGLYEVDVKTLEAKCLIKDGNAPRKGFTLPTSPGAISSKLPGYHGKGLYSGQGRVIYANNGEHSDEAKRIPTTPSGALGEWNGSGDWQLIRRNQFTEVTGPGGIHGNPNPETDPIWSIGWDARSLILMTLDAGKWHSYRLPKASHTYDGAHGWNTEWPRIRDVGQQDLLMTMHGMFWKFPKSFSASKATGIRPRSTYLKVIGDFCQWNDRLVFGCDDTAADAFLNTKRDSLASPGQSNSNLWFTDSDTPDRLGPALGRGAAWLNDEVPAAQPSEPFLFAGFTHRSLHLSHQGEETRKIRLEIDEHGDGNWRSIGEHELAPKGSLWLDFPATTPGEWIRLQSSKPLEKVTAWFTYRQTDKRSKTPDPSFDTFAEVDEPAATPGGLFRTLGKGRQSLLFSPLSPAADAPSHDAVYELGADMVLKPYTHAIDKNSLLLSTKLNSSTISVDAASVLYTDHAGKRWRLPKGPAAFDRFINHAAVRMLREVSTEREVLHCHGTFYELPAENASGMIRIRPIASHSKLITDFASYRGLLVLGGTKSTAKSDSIIRSDDGKAALWAGAFDDLWKLGIPRGTGGPWADSKVKSGEVSDPYLMTGYDQKSLVLSQSGGQAITIEAEVDVAGDGTWRSYRSFELAPGASVQHQFPASFQASWIRFRSSADATATATLTY
jgi:hypothetical protein